MRRFVEQSKPVDKGKVALEGWTQHPDGSSLPSLGVSLKAWFGDRLQEKAERIRESDHYPDELLVEAEGLQKTLGEKKGDANGGVAYIPINRLAKFLMIEDAVIKSPKQLIAELGRYEELAKFYTNPYFDSVKEALDLLAALAQEKKPLDSKQVEGVYRKLLSPAARALATQNGFYNTSSGRRDIRCTPNYLGNWYFGWETNGPYPLLLLRSAPQPEPSLKNKIANHIEPFDRKTCEQILSKIKTIMEILEPISFNSKGSDKYAKAMEHRIGGSWSRTQRALSALENDAQLDATKKMLSLAFDEIMKSTDSMSCLVNDICSSSKVLLRIVEFSIRRMWQGLD